MKDFAEGGLWNSEVEIPLLKNQDRTGRPVEFDDKLFKADLEENFSLSVEELTIKLNSNHTTVIFNNF